jgi:hypothetical protein
MAQRYLDTLHTNRTKSRVEVAIHEQNLRTGTWYPEISPVFLDDADLSWDAQHRFAAVVNTGISAWMLFIRGVGEEAAEFIDTGRKRTYSDVLRMHEVVDYKRQSVLAKYIALHELYGIDGIRSPGKYAVAQAEKNKHLNSDAALKSIHAGEALYRATGANGTWAAYAAYRTGFLDPDGEFTVDPFWEKVRSGTGLELGDPELALRNWLQHGSRSGAGRKPADRRLMELFSYANAWNKHVTGQRYQRVNPVFKTRRDGKSYFPAENVPDFLPRDAGQMSRMALSRLYKEMKGSGNVRFETETEQEMA